METSTRGTPRHTTRERTAVTPSLILTTHPPDGCWEVSPHLSLMCLAVVVCPRIVSTDVDVSSCKIWLPPHLRGWSVRSNGG